MSVAILREGDYLIAAILSDLTDKEVVALRGELIELVGRYRSRGLVIDVSAVRGFAARKHAARAWPWSGSGPRRTCTRTTR